MKRFLMLALIFVTVITAFSGCKLINSLDKENREKIDRAKEIAVQYIADKYNIEAKVVGWDYRYVGVQFSFIDRATDDAYISMQYGKEKFDVRVNKISGRESECYDNRQFNEITDALKGYIVKMCRLEDYTIQIHYGIESCGERKNGLLNKNYTDDNLKDVLEGKLQIVIKTYNNDYLNDITEEEAENLYEVLENIEFGIAVLNHDDKQSMKKTDFTVSDLTVSVDQAKSAIKESAVYIKSAVLIKGVFYGLAEEKENSFGIYAFDVKDYDGIKCVAVNKEDVFHIQKENGSVNPKNWNGWGALNAKVLSDVYSIPVEDLKNSTGSIYIYFPISKMKNHSKYKHISCGFCYTKDGREEYFAELLYKRIGDYYRINTNAIQNRSGYSECDGFKFVMLGDN